MGKSIAFLLLNGWSCKLCLAIVSLMRTRDELPGDLWSPPGLDDYTSILDDWHRPGLDQILMVTDGEIWQGRTRIWSLSGPRRECKD